ncbi:MAG: hypothetical protein ACLQU5_22255 [Isosphaeraceae bacterium]
MVPDYYARLGVDPGADPAEIEAAWKQQQPVWSMGTRNPKTRHTNQFYLDEVPALRLALMMILPPMSSTPRPGDRSAGPSSTWDGVTCTMRWGSSAMLRRRSSRPAPTRSGSDG